MIQPQIKALQKNFTLQHDQSDCGVACLLSLIKYYGGDNNFENLRRLSGTNTTGTTLLGLYQAANEAGFNAEGCEADIKALIEHGKPCILHITLENQLQHYVVCYGILPLFTQRGKGDEVFIIGDPAKGIIHYTRIELEKVWLSKMCLTLIPANTFTKDSDTKKIKRKWIKNLVKEDAPLLAIAAVLGVAIAVLGLAMTVFSQRLIDDILPKKNYQKLYLGIGLVFLLLLVKEGLSVLRQYFLIRQAKFFNTRIIGFFFKHLLQLPKPFFDTRKIGEFTARLNDTTRIQRVISQLAGNVVIDILVVLVSIIFVFTYSIVVGIVCIVFLPFFYWIVHAHNKAILNQQKQIMSNYANTEGNYISTLQGIEPVKNNNKQEFFEKINTVVYQKYQDAIYELGAVQIKLGFIVNAFGAAFLIGILLYCSYYVLQQTLKTGELIAILSMCGSLLPSVVNLALITIPVNEAKIAFDRMFEFTEAKLEKKDGQLLQHFENLQVRGISFRFVGRKPLFHQVSFDVNVGEIIAILGENGCGKSTLLQILQKDYSPELGDILLNNEIELQNFQLSNWRDIMATVPQNIHIFNTTVIENIAFDDALNKPVAVATFLKVYGFMPFIDSLPQSAMTIVGEEGINLSGGQKQMIALARALYKKPKLLILDEATAAMDRESERFVLNLITTMKKEIAVIFITHRLHLLKSFCDRIYILENGKTTSTGTHDKLIKEDNMYSRYWTDIVA